MFDLRHFVLRFVPISGLLLLVVLTTEVNAQFDSIIFARNDIYRATGSSFSWVTRMMMVAMILFLSNTLPLGVMMPKPYYFMGGKSNQPQSFLGNCI
jgi:preprotein translocase subunit SecG